MNTSAPIKWLLPVMLTGALGGCLNTSPVTDTRQFFVIESGPSPDSQIAAADIDHIVGLLPIQVPSYLRDNRIVVRKSETEITYSEVVRWGEPLGSGLQRVIRSDVDIAIGNIEVIASPWQRGDADFELIVRFHQCEVDSSGLAIADAEWHCSKADDPTTSIFGRGHIEKPGPAPQEDPAGAVTTFSAAIHELSLQIANTVRTCIDGTKESPETETAQRKSG